jgi:WD40 repeat protein
MEGHRRIFRRTLFGIPANQQRACHKGEHGTSGNHDVFLQDATTGENQLVLTDHDNVVNCIASSCDGTQLAIGTALHVLEGFTGTIKGVALPPASIQFASGSEDGIIRVWDVRTGQAFVVMEGHTDDVYSVTYSSNGHQLESGGEDRTVWLCDA